MGVYKILAVSDTHVPTIAQRLPEKIFEEARSCELIIHAGDIVSREALGLLSLNKRTEAVRGNMDFPDLAAKLPISRVIQEGKRRIGITHGYIGKGRDTAERAASVFPRGTVDCVVFGHSHIQMRDAKDGVLLFNPGSATAGRGGSGNSFGILELRDTLQARFVQLGLE